MEYIILIAVIISACVTVAANRKSLTGIFDVLVRLYNLKKQVQEIRRYIAEEHKKTRKETQELKTRATQDRKDLNDIQRRLTKSK